MQLHANCNSCSVVHCYSSKVCCQLFHVCLPFIFVWCYLGTAMHVSNGCGSTRNSFFFVFGHLRFERESHVGYMARVPKQTGCKGIMIWNATDSWFGFKQYLITWTHLDAFQMCRIHPQSIVHSAVECQAWQLKTMREHQGHFKKSKVQVRKRMMMMMMMMIMMMMMMMMLMIMLAHMVSATVVLMVKMICVLLSSLQWTHMQNTRMLHT